MSTTVICLVAATHTCWSRSCLNLALRVPDMLRRLLASDACCGCLGVATPLASFCTAQAEFELPGAFAALTALRYRRLSVQGMASAQGP